LFLPSENSFSTIRRYSNRLFVASISPVVGFSLRFVRTVIITRFLSPSDYGVVVALSAVVTSFEFLGDLGLDRFVAIKAGPQRAEAVAAAQQILLVRCAIIAALIFLLAPFLASIFGAPDHVDSMRWLAGLPLIHAFINYRIYQVRQEYRNGPVAITSVVANVMGLLAIYPALTWFHDERAMLVSFYVDTVAYVALSRVVLSQERVVRVTPEMRQAALRYGLPLVANGIGLVVLSQLDRLVVGNLFGLDMLARYSLTVTLALVPLTIISSVVVNLSMAFLIKWDKSPATSQAASFIVTWGTLAIASCYAVGVGIFLDVLLPLVYGSQYSVPSGIHALVAILACIRCSRLGPTTCLLTFGKTHRLAVGNLLSGIGLALGYMLGLTLHRLDAVLAGIVVGEIISTLYLYRLARGYLPMGAVARHAALLALPAVITAYLASLDPNLFMRAAMLATCLIVGVDMAFVYRRHLTPFRNRS
jgi:O-antigen/teichoic acid export membrane protein